MIIDIDNCIADDLWRIPRINWNAKGLQRYHDYHMLSPWDAPSNIDRFRDYEGDIIVLTGRPVLYRTMTEEWLWRNGVHHKWLLMRNDDDFSKSNLLKLKQLGWLADHYGITSDDIEVAYDDRKDVVDMYTSCGLNAQRLFIHEEGVYHEFSS